MENPTSTPEIQNPEMIKLPWAFRMAKWWTYITIFLYCIQIIWNYYLKWNGNFMDTNAFLGIKILTNIKDISGIFTIILLIVGSIQLLRIKRDFKKWKLSLVVIILLFCIFWYQWKPFYAHNQYLQSNCPPNAKMFDPCHGGTVGRPFRSRWLFWKSKEAEVVKWKTWNTIK